MDGMNAANAKELSLKWLKTARKPRNMSSLCDGIQEAVQRISIHCERAIFPRGLSDWTGLRPKTSKIRMSMAVARSPWCGRREAEVWDENDIGDLVKLVYAAPLSINGWESVLDSLVCNLNARWAQLHVSDFYSKEVPLSDLNPREPEVLSSYIDQYALSDPRLPYALRADRRSYTRAEMVNEDEFKKSALYNDLLVPCDAAQSMVLSLRGLTRGSNFIIMMRKEQDGPFDQEDCRFLSFLEPHIHQAILLQRQITALDRIVRVTSETLDAIGVAVILLEVNGCAVYLNRPAEEILKTRDGLYLDSEGHCRAVDATISCQLLRLIGRASKTSIGDGLKPGGYMAVPRPSGKRPFHVHISPLPFERIDLGTAPVVVALTVIDPEYHPLLGKDVLSVQFGLTPAECRLAASFTETASLKRSAEKLHISEGTARQYLKQIFQKTDTTSQVELMRLLIRLLP